MPEKIIAKYQHHVDRNGFYTEASPVDDARFIVGDLVTRARTLQDSARTVAIKVDDAYLTLSTEIDRPPQHPNEDVVRGSTLRMSSGIGMDPAVLALPKPLIAGEVSVRNTPGGDLAIVFAPRYTDMAYIPAQFLDELADRIRIAKRLQTIERARQRKEAKAAARR